MKKIACFIVLMAPVLLCKSQTNRKDTLSEFNQVPKDTCFTQLYSDSVLVVKKVLHDPVHKTRVIEVDTFILDAQRKKWKIIRWGKKYDFWQYGRKQLSEISMCKTVKIDNREGDFCIVNKLTKEFKDEDDNTVYIISFYNGKIWLRSYYFNPVIGIMAFEGGEIISLYKFTIINL